MFEHLCISYCTFWHERFGMYYKCMLSPVNVVTETEPLRDSSQRDTIAKIGKRGYRLT